MRGTLQKKIEGRHQEKEENRDCNKQVNDGILNGYDAIRPHTYNYI